MQGKWSLCSCFFSCFKSFLFMKYKTKKHEHFVVPRIIPLTKCMKKLWYTGHIFPSDKIRMTSVTSFRFHLSWITSHSSLIRYIPYLTQTLSGPQNSLPEKNYASLSLQRITRVRQSYIIIFSAAKNYMQDVSAHYLKFSSAIFWAW